MTVIQDAIVLLKCPIYFLFCSDDFCSCDFEENVDIQYYMFLWKINRMWEGKVNSNNSMDSNQDYKDITLKHLQNSQTIISEFVKNGEGDKEKVTQQLNNWHVQNANNKKKFKWTHTFKQCEGTNNIFIITITETFMNLPTSGGSSFLILQTSAHTKDFCPITDLFNGTYIARCTVHEIITRIQGTVDFVNFTAFTQMAQPMRRQLFNIPVNIISQSHSVVPRFNRIYHTASRGKLSGSILLF